MDRSSSHRILPRSFRDIRYAAVDLDGTLLDALCRPFTGVQCGIAGLRASGITPILVTGRSPTGFSQLEDIDLLLGECDDDILLCYGNTILSRRNRLLRHRRQCETKILEQLLQMPGIDLVMNDGSSLIATSRSASTYFALAYRIARSQIPVVPVHLFPICLFTDLTVFIGNSTVSHVVAQLPCEVQRIDSLGAEVVRPIGTDKAEALQQHMLGKFGEADLSRTLAIGNGADDATMLLRSAFGIATLGADRAALATADLCLTVGLGQYLLNLFAESGNGQL